MENKFINNDTLINTLKVSDTQSYVLVILEITIMNQRQQDMFLVGENKTIKKKTLGSPNIEKQKRELTKKCKTRGTEGKIES